MFNHQLYFLIIVFLIFVFSYICILNFFIVIHRAQHLVTVQLVNTVSYANPTKQVRKHSKRITGQRLDDVHNVCITHLAAQRVAQVTQYVAQVRNTLRSKSNCA